MTTRERDSRILLPKNEGADPFGTHPWQSPAGRPPEILVGVAEGVLTLLLAVGTVAAIAAPLRAAGDWAPMLIVTAVLAFLTVFFGNVAWRLIANKARAGGGLLPPWLILMFGIFLEATSLLAGIASSNWTLLATGVLLGAAATIYGINKMRARRTAPAGQGGG